MNTTTRRTSPYTVTVSPLNPTTFHLMELIGRLGNRTRQQGHIIQGSWISSHDGFAAVSVRLSNDDAARTFAHLITEAEPAVSVQILTGLGIHRREIM